MRQLEKALLDLTARAEPLPLDVLINRIETQLTLELAPPANTDHREAPNARTRRAAAMQAPTQHETTGPHPITPPLLRRRKAWVFAAAFILILATIGIAALVLRSDTPPVTDEPAPPPTTVAETPEKPIVAETPEKPIVAETPEKPIDVESLTWSRVPLSEEGLGEGGLGITVGGPGLVAVGSIYTGTPNHFMPTVWTSPDGYTWSQVPYDEAPHLKIKAVTAGGPGLVAVGGYEVWTSPDGYTWSRRPRDPSVVPQITGDLQGVIAGGPGLVAFGESGGTSAVWTSPEGYTYTQVPRGESGGITAGVWTSPEGYTWTQVPHDEDMFGRSSINSMTRGGPGLVAVGLQETFGGDPESAVVWTSPDGYTWTRVPHDPSVFGKGTFMTDVAAGTSGLVAVGEAIWTSPDGFSWTRVSHDGASSVAAIGDGFVAVGGWDGRTAWTSPDGFTWNRIPDAEAVFGYEAGLYDVIAGGPGAVALGGSPEGTAIWVATPTDADEPAPATTPADFSDG